MSLVETTVTEGVGHVVLNRTAARNALSLALLEELAQAIGACDADPEIAAILFYANGQHFSAGADLNEAWPTSLEAITISGAGPRRMLANSRKLVIAAVQGTALGGGLELALSADIMLVDEDAVLALPEFLMGTLPVAGTIARLVDTAGRQRAADIVLSGRSFNGREAVAMGLAVASYPAGTLLAEASSYARKVARSGVVSAILAKRALRAAQSGGDEGAHETSLAEIAFALTMGRLVTGRE